ncbi:MAG: NAD(P)H-dependent oxidoreductase [Planctomycetes bacterium]|nr:NAD(P)H-dependent oxidoreductase [Planctomycetota bacterium]
MNMALLAVMGMMLCGMTAVAQDAGANRVPKILIVFFSKTNNTRTIAEQIHSRVGGDMFHVATKKPYPQDYRETTRIARIEFDNNERPELAATIAPEDMRAYDIIFFGYPNWWGTIPMAMFTFLEQFDWAGKTIIPFCTHGSGGLGRGPADIGKLAPGATLRQGLAIQGNSASRAQGEVDNWLRQLGF